MRAVGDAFHLYLREVRASLRMPAYLIMSIVQPMLWLLLFAPLFGAVERLPGFGGDSYLQFLTPGLAVMTAGFSSAFSGMGILRDLDRGVVDRLLATPVSRPAMIGARGLHSASVVVVQAGVILIVAALLGVRPPGGAAGLAAVLAASALLGAGLGGVSTGLALLTGRQEILLALTNFLVIPLLFLSSLLMAPELMPDWIRTAAAFNPVDWAVRVARVGFRGEDWAAVGGQTALLVAFTAVTWWLAARAFARHRARN